MMISLISLVSATIEVSEKLSIPLVKEDKKNSDGNKKELAYISLKEQRKLKNQLRDAQKKTLSKADDKTIEVNNTLKDTKSKELKTKKKNDKVKRKLNKNSKIKKTVKKKALSRTLGFKRMSSTPILKKGFECELAARFYPMLFYSLTNSIEIILEWRSTCIEYPIVQYLMLKPGDNEDMFIHKHPTFLHLTIFGRDFEIKYVNPVIKGEWPDVHIAYKFARFYPSSISEKVNLFEENWITLKPPKPSHAFTHIDIKKLEIIQNPLFCKTEINGTIFVCNIMH